MSTVVAKPTAKQKLVSRHVCFFCGASPLSSMVSLWLCPGCECVACCSEEHRKADNMVAHNLECGCNKGFVSLAGRCSRNAVPSAQHLAPRHRDGKGDLGEDAHRSAFRQPRVHCAPLLPGRGNAWAMSATDGVGDQSCLMLLVCALA